MTLHMADSTPELPVVELRRDAIRRACFEAGLRFAIGDGARAYALCALVAHFIELGATGSHASA